MLRQDRVLISPFDSWDLRAAQELNYATLLRQAKKENGARLLVCHLVAFVGPSSLPGLEFTTYAKINLYVMKQPADALKLSTQSLSCRRCLLWSISS